MIRPNRLVFAGVAVVVALAAIGWYRWKANDEVAYAKRIHQCVVDSDSACVFSSVARYERVLYDLDEAKVRGLLTRYFRPYVRQYGNDAIVLFDRQNRIAKLKASIRTRFDDDSEIRIDVIKTEDGFKCPGIITMLLMCVAKDPVPTKARVSPIVDTIHGWLIHFANEQPLLESLGFRGIVRSESEGLLLWKRWRELMQKDIDTIMQANPAGKWPPS